MSGNITKRIVNWLIKGHVIEPDDYEVYLFGLEQLVVSIVSMAVILLIGVLMDMLLPCIIFIAAYRFMRQYAGGYHASTRGGCYLLSVVTIIVVLSILKYISISIYAVAAMAAASGIVIWLLAPVDTENKRIDERERVYYRKRTIIVLVTEMLVVAICMIAHYEEGAECVVMGLVILGISLAGENLKKSGQHKCVEEK